MPIVTDLMAEITALIFIPVAFCLFIASLPYPARYRTRTMNRCRFMSVNFRHAAWPLCPLVLTARLRDRVIMNRCHVPCFVSR